VYSLYIYHRLKNASMRFDKLYVINEHDDDDDDDDDDSGVV